MDTPPKSPKSKSLRKSTKTKSTEMKESKKLSGRRIKGKVIEKGKEVVKKLDFSFLTPNQVEDATADLRQKVERIKSTLEEKNELLSKIQDLKVQIPKTPVDVNRLKFDIKNMLRSRSAKSISKQMDRVTTRITKKQDETMPTTTEQAPKQEDVVPKQIMTEAPTTTMDSKPPKTESKPADKPAEMKKQPKLRGKKSKMVEDKPVEPSIDKSKDDEDKIMLGMPTLPDLPSKPKKADKPKKKQPAKVEDKPVPITLDKTRDEVEGIPPPPPPSTPPEPPSISLNRPTKERKDKVTDVEEDKLPTKVDLIPPERLSSEDKSLQKLKADIDYFYKNFQDKLRRIKKTKSNNIEVVRRFHKRIVALLRGDKKEDKKNIGVVIKGSDFIKEKLKEIILENSINGLSAEDLLVNIEGEPVEGKTDAGSYEFKTNKTSGKTYAKNEPVFRYIPQTEPPKPKRKINRIPNPKTMVRNQYTTARKEVAKNPFLTASQPTIKLKTLY